MSGSSSPKRPPKAKPQEVRRAAAFDWIERAKTDLACGQPGAAIDSLQYATKLLKESIAMDAKEAARA